MPNTREKLIELLINSPGLETLFGDEEEFAKNADWLITNGVTVQQWIPVTERLPEKSDYYLAFTDTSVVCVLPFSLQYKLFNTFDGDGTRHHIPVSHWMPLPEPPKGE